MISKELLMKVVKDNSIGFVDRGLRNQKKIGYFSNKDSEKKYIDVYRLAHKCKEWAWENDYALIISPNEIEIYSLIDGATENEFYDNAMPYSSNLVFKACEWILENKENN